MQHCYRRNRDTDGSIIVLEPELLLAVVERFMLFTQSHRFVFFRFKLGLMDFPIFSIFRVKMKFLFRNLVRNFEDLSGLARTRRNDAKRLKETLAKVTMDYVFKIDPVPLTAMLGSRVHDLELVFCLSLSLGP